MPKSIKIGSGVRFEKEVLEYLDRIAKQEERTRSQVINRIIKEHAARHGIPLPSPSIAHPFAFLASARGINR